jgi:hypothetical protein
MFIIKFLVFLEFCTLIIYIQYLLESAVVPRPYLALRHVTFPPPTTKITFARELQV